MSFGQTYIDQTGDTGASGFAILTPKAVSQRFDVKRPVSSGRTVVRVLPAMGANGVPLPERNSPAMGDFSEWIAALEVFTGGESGKITFICQLPDPNDPRRVKSVREAMPPPWLFYDRVSRMADMQEYAHLGLSTLLKGSRKSPAPVQKPQRMGFIQVLLLESGGKAYKDAAGNPSPLTRQVMLLPISARQALESLVDEENPKEVWGGQPDHPQRYKNAGWLDPSSGRLLILSRDDPGQQQQQFGGSIDLRASVPTGFGGGYQGGAGRRTREEAIPLYKAALSAICPLPNEYLIWQPWEDLLQLYTPDKQVELMLRVFRPELIKFVLGDQDYVPASVLNARMISAPAPSQGPSQPATGPAWNLPPMPTPVEGLPAPQSAPQVAGPLAAAFGQLPQQQPAQQPVQDPMKAAFQQPPQQQQVLPTLHLGAPTVPPGPGDMPITPGVTDPRAANAVPQAVAPFDPAGSAQRQADVLKALGDALAPPPGPSTQ